MIQNLFCQMIPHLASISVVLYRQFTDNSHARRVDLARRVDAAWIWSSARVPRIFPTHATHDVIIPHPNKTRNNIYPVIRLVHGITFRQMYMYTYLYLIYTKQLFI